MIGLLQYLLSYLGMFISSMITSASIFFPLPGQLIPVFAVVTNLNPFLSSAVIGAGSMIGELTGYGLGLASRKVSESKFKQHKKLVKVIKKFYHKYAFWMVLVTAFLFFPFDLVGIISGLSRYDIRKFLVAGFIGKFLKALLTFILVQYGIHVFGFTR